MAELVGKKVGKLVGRDVGADVGRLVGNIVGLHSSGGESARLQTACLVKSA